ncbi:MAG: LPXTG cell wall anchor domain-containing protein [Planctomycetaceae bacterium]|jgi:LPXTG-motif cell wall-anchored protein|nr:LPXTG cell wall anchor domain-containing protein [Planctomycetaceae bacterium]
MLESIDWTTILVVGMVLLAGYGWLQMRRRKRTWPMPYPPHHPWQHASSENHEGAGR